MEKRNKSNVLNTPNLLSLLRILLIPVFLAMMLQHKVFLAFVVFLLASLTDLLDGFTARLWNQKTRIGSYLDPAADKLLMTSSFIILTFPSLNSPNIIPYWLTIAVISRDLLIVSSSFVIYKVRGQKVFTPSLLGKICTVCQFTVILLVLFFNSTQISASYLYWLYLLTLAFTFLSAVNYSHIGFKMILPSKKAENF